MLQRASQLVPNVVPALSRPEFATSYALVYRPFVCLWVAHPYEIVVHWLHGEAHCMFWMNRSTRHNAERFFLALTRSLNHTHYSHLVARDKCPLTLNPHPSCSLPELRLINVTCRLIFPKIQHTAGHFELPKSVIGGRVQIHWVHQRAGPRHLRLSYKR